MSSPDLVKGLRSPVGAQAGNEKLATGTQAKRTLNILQLNVQGIRNKQLEPENYFMITTST